MGRPRAIRAVKMLHATSRRIARSSRAARQKTLQRHLPASLCQPSVCLRGCVSRLYCHSPLNLLNNCAVGVFQLQPMDEQSTAEEFFRQVERTSRRLSDFDTATAALTGAAEGVQRFQVAAADASKTFARMMEMLGRVAEVTAASNHRADLLTKQLASFQEQSEGVLTELRGFTSGLKEPLAWVQKSATHTCNVMVAGRQAFEELREMAASIRAPLNTATDVTRTMWGTVKEIRNSLCAITDREKEQSAQLVTLAETFRELHATIQDLLRLMAAHAEAVGESAPGRVASDAPLEAVAPAGYRRFPTSAPAGRPTSRGRTRAARMVVSRMPLAVRGSSGSSTATQANGPRNHARQRG